MTTTEHENKKILQDVFAGMAVGDARPLVQAMREDVRWTVKGTSGWSRDFVGRKAVIEELFAGLAARIEMPMKTIPIRFIAEGDVVVVEARGDNRTRDGKPYNNQYCFVFTLKDGKLSAVEEYCDTALVEDVLGKPA